VAAVLVADSNDDSGGTSSSAIGTQARAICIDWLRTTARCAKYSQSMYAKQTLMLR
jgi:hypothetical protein